MTDRVGEQFGNYRLLRLLGRGGFAEVYLGEHCLLKSLAAIKILHTSLSEKEVNNFLKEAQTLATLIHPHIIRVLDFDVVENTPFLVLDYASGGTLRQRHPRGSIVPLDSIVSYVNQVADALNYAHSAKIIHRDIKPENMLLDQHGSVLLGDFGIALLLQTSQAQSLQRIAGTAVYMAPEQFQGKAQRASDQYALGIVAYEWLSGKHPFHGSFSEIASQHLLVPPPSLHVKTPSILPSIEAAVLKALAKDPQVRFTDVQEFALALEQAYLTSDMQGGSTSSSGTYFHPVPSTKQLAEGVPLDANAHLSPIESVTPSTMKLSHTPSSSLHNTPVHAISQRTKTLHPQSTAFASRERLARSRVVLIAVILFLILVGSAGLFYSSVRNQRISANATATSLARIQASMTANTQMKATVNALATVDAHMYANATAHGIMSGFDPQHTQFNTAEQLLSASNVSQLKLAWKAPIGGAISTSSPIVSSGVTYVGSLDGNLYAFTAITGVPLWKAHTGDAIYSTPAVVGGMVYVGSLDSNLYAFNATSGKVLWSTSTTSPIYSSPIVVNNMVYIVSTDGNLHALNASTGKMFWSVSAMTSSVPGTSTITSSPAVANGMVYFGSPDNNLYAFDAITGTLRWRVPTQSNITVSPAVVNSTVYISSGGDLYAFNARTGALAWTYTSTQVAFSHLAVAYGMIYVGASYGNLYAIDTKTGKLRWVISLSTSNPDNTNPPSPTVANGVVYVASYSGNLFAYAAATGAVLWTNTIDPNVLASPTVANGVVYIGSTHNDLFAFHLPATS